MSAQLQRAIAAVILTASLLLTLATGSFLASGRSLHSAQTARAVTPLGSVCGGGGSAFC